MLWLVFYIGDHRYALPSRSVIEVLPLVELQRLPNSPTAFAGVFTYRGTVTPAINLPRAATEAECPRRLSSRMIMVNDPVASNAMPVGILADRVTELRELDSQGPTRAGAGAANVSALGPVISDNQGLIQLIELSRLWEMTKHE